MTNNSLFILTFDESSSLSPDNQIPTLFLGPMIKPGNYAETINHFNVLRTLEDLYHLPYAGAAAAATPIKDVWMPPKLKVILMGNGQVQITWPGTAVLQSSVQVAGPYLDITNVTSPYVATPAGESFYRLKSP